MKKIVILMLAACAATAQAAGDIEKGKVLAEKFNCASCHGKDYNSPIDPTYPKLAGQHADYLEHALSAYKRGANAANGRGNPIMAGQVKELSKDDMKHIAAYLQSLSGNLLVKK